jgi:hypothetical protein
VVQFVDHRVNHAVMVASMMAVVVTYNYDGVPDPMHVLTESGGSESSSDNDE